MRGHPLRERRKKMVKLRAQGVPMATIVEDFVGEYHVSPQALYQDWWKRKQWIREVVRLDDPTLIDEMLQGLMQVLPNAWYEYKTNPNPSVKLGSLKLAKDTYKDIIEILQSLGIAIRVPHKLEIIAPWLNKFTSQETNTPPTKDN